MHAAHACSSGSSAVTAPPSPGSRARAPTGSSSSTSARRAPKLEPGLQPENIGATRVFVTPNPSGANPAANLDRLVPLYRKLARLRASLAG